MNRAIAKNRCWSSGQRHIAEHTDTCGGESPVRYRAAMPPMSRPATLNPEPSYTVWRAAALKALQKLHPPAVAVTREGVLTRCYVLGLSPPQAAELARRTNSPICLTSRDLLRLVDRIFRSRFLRSGLLPRHYSRIRNHFRDVDSPRFSIGPRDSTMNRHGGKRPGTDRPKGAASRANEQVRQEAAALSFVGHDPLRK